MKTNEWYGDIEYRMTKEMAKQIITSYKGPSKNREQILCDFVNNNNIVKGHCVKVSTDL